MRASPFPPNFVLPRFRLNRVKLPPEFSFRVVPLYNRILFSIARPGPFLCGVAYLVRVEGLEPTHHKDNGI